MSDRLALIIEDQKDIAEIYSNALQMSKFESYCIYEGKTALEDIQQLRPQLIVLDMNLPHVSGHFLYKEIRSLPHLANVPVIICTANAVMADAMQREIGDRDFILIKPVSIHQLTGLTERLFR